MLLDTLNQKRKNSKLGQSFTHTVLRKAYYFYVIDELSEINADYDQ